MKSIGTIVVAMLLTTQLFAQGMRVDSSRIARPPAPVTATLVDSAPAGRMFSATVLHADELRRRGIVSLSDALRLVPGIAIVQAGSAGAESSLFMRGGEDDFVLVLLDGVAINEPGGRVNLAFVPVDNIDRIEVARGPVSALYGSGGVAGVVQIFTKRAGRERTSDVATSWGTKGTRNTELSLSVAGPASRYVVGAARYRTRGVYDFNSRTWNNSYSGSAQFDAGRSTVVTFNGRYIDGHYKFPANAAGIPVDSNSQSVERRLAAGGSVAWRLSGDVDAVIDAAYLRQTDGVANPADALTPFPFDVHSESERRAAGARLNFHGWRRTVVTGGIEYAIQKNQIEGVSYTERDVDRKTRSAFGQLLARSDKNFEIAFGARVDDSDRFGAHSTWRVGMGTPLGPTTRLTGSLGTAFREPRYSELTGGGVALANGDLQVERARSWQAGVEQSLLQANVVLSATYFRQAFHGLISLVAPTPDPGQFQNSDRAFANGWELEMRVNPSDALRLSSGVTMLDARFAGTGPNSGLHLPRRPSLYGNTSAVLQASKGLSLTSDVSYFGRRSDTRFLGDGSAQEERLGGYARLDISGEFVVPQNDPTDYPLLLTLRVENVLDRKFATIPGFDAPSRRFTIGARLLLAY